MYVRETHFPNPASTGLLRQKEPQLHAHAHALPNTQHHRHFIMSLLSGKHAVVVGATGTIGSHIARAFAAQGAVVSLLGRTAVQARVKLEPQLDPFTKGSSASSSSDGPSSHQFIKLDVADKSSIKDVFGPREIQVGVPGFPCIVVCGGGAVNE